MGIEPLATHLDHSETEELKSDDFNCIASYIKSLEGEILWLAS